MSPISIKKKSLSELAIQWSDSHESLYEIQMLRERCPCASCQSENGINNSTILFPILVPGKYEIADITPVGAYAIQMKWKDGHTIGIYTFEYLRNLCSCKDCVKNV